MSTPNDYAIQIALETKGSLRRQRNERRAGIILALIFLAGLLAYGWMVVLVVLG